MNGTPRGYRASTHLLERLADNALRLAVRVNVGRVPGRDPTVPRGLEQRERLHDVSTQRTHVHAPRRTSSSLITQGAHLSVPIDMAPRMGTETRRPELPSRRYSTCGCLFSADILVCEEVEKRGACGEAGKRGRKWCGARGAARARALCILGAPLSITVS
jgi:hypothetical protein